MSTKKMTVFVHLSNSQWGAGTEYSLFNLDMTDYGYTLVATSEIEFEEPSRNDVVAGLVRGLRHEQQEIKAEAQSKVNRLQERIDSLLCLEYKEEAA